MDPVVSALASGLEVLQDQPYPLLKIQQVHVAYIFIKSSRSFVVTASSYRVQ